MAGTYQKIYEAVRRVPAGKVASYGQIALLAGDPRWPRVVGYALRACGDPSVPCHRVLYKDGSPSPSFGPGGERQRALLRAEGVGFLPDGRVDMARYGFLPEG